MDRTVFQVAYGSRDPNMYDWKILPALYVNSNTDELFIKGSKGWIKIPTEYSCMHDQPERSKREDIGDLGHDFTGIPTTEESWCRKCNEEDHVIKSKMMRCSEHGGDVVREVR
jgi:hypothetical protein